MPESRDQQLEADIARTLKYNALVTPRQQQDARARLLNIAATQTVLPPPVIAAAPARAPLREHAHSFGQRMVSFYRFLMVDSICYERARRPPNFFQYYNAHRRGAFSIISVST